MSAWDGPDDKRAVTFSARAGTVAGSNAISRENTKHNVIGTAYSSTYNTPTSRGAAELHHERNIDADKRSAEWKRRQEQQQHQQEYQNKLKQKLKEKKQQESAKEKEYEEQNRHKIVDGKNIEHTYQRDTTNGSDIEDVLHQQGFDGLPQVVTPKEFAKAVKSSGIIAARGIGAYDATTLAKYESDLKTGKFYVNCGGGAAYGHGMYMARAKDGSQYIKIKNVNETANSYGNYQGRKSVVVNMTLHKSASIVDYRDLIKQIQSDSSITSHIDEGVYAALKGYDAINVDMGSGSADYTVVLNRTKLIIAE